MIAMPYSNSVAFLELGEPIPSPVAGAADADLTITVWMLWNEAGGSDPGRKQEEDQSTQVLVNYYEQAAPARFSFQGPTDFGNIGRGVGLSVQDIHGAFLFRSGSFPDALPTDPIEIVASSRTFFQNDIQGLLPTLPMQVNSGTTLTSLTTRLADADKANNLDAGIDFISKGTTNAPGVVVDFQFTGRLVFQPTSDIAEGPFEAMVVGVENPFLVFTSGPSVLSSVEAAVLNALEPFIWHDYGGILIQNINSNLNVSILTSAGRLFAGGALPSGINLSVRTIDVSSVRGMEVRAALGAFGGVLSKFPSSSGSSGTSLCPVHTLASLGLLASDLAVLRDIRDRQIAGSNVGRRLVESYYHAGVEVSALLNADRNLARRASSVVSDLVAALLHQETPSQMLRNRGETLVRDLADRGSPELRRTILDALSSPFPWSSIQNLSACDCSGSTQNDQEI